MVGIRRFEITIVSADNLPDVRRLGRMKTYAAVSLNGATKSTHVDSEGDTNPRWNYRFVFTADESSLQRSELTVVVNLFCERFLGDKYIGQARIPVKELLDMGIGSHKTLSYTVYGTANGALNIHYWFEEKLVAPPPSQKEKTVHTGSVQVFNSVVIQSFEAPKAAPPAEPKVARLKSLEPPKTVPHGGTNGAALHAPKAVPQAETKAAPFKSLEPPKTLPQGGTNGATLQAAKTMPRVETNAAPLKAMEASKTAAQGDTNRAALKPLQAPKTLHPVKPLQAPETMPNATKTLHPVKPLQAPETVPNAPKTLNPVKPLQAPETMPHATKTFPLGRTNASPNGAVLKAPEAPKAAAAQGDKKAAAISVATGVEWKSS